MPILCKLTLGKHKCPQLFSFYHCMKGIWTEIVVAFLKESCVSILKVKTSSFVGYDFFVAYVAYL